GPWTVNSVAFSPDGRTLAAGNTDGTVRLWDVTSRRQIGDPLNGHDGVIHSVAFSGDGKTLATGGADGTVRLWGVSYLVRTGVQPGRQDPGQRRRRRDGATVGRVLPRRYGSSSM